VATLAAPAQLNPANPDRLAVLQMDHPPFGVKPDQVTLEHWERAIVDRGILCDMHDRTWKYQFCHRGSAMQSDAGPSYRGQRLKVIGLENLAHTVGAIVVIETWMFIPRWP
jgi:hypothetical protein